MLAPFKFQVMLYRLFEYTATIVLTPVSVALIAVTVVPPISQWWNVFPVGGVTFVGNVRPVPNV